MFGNEGTGKWESMMERKEEMGEKINGEVFRRGGDGW